MGQNIFNTPDLLLKGIKARFYNKLTSAAKPQVTPFTYIDTSNTGLEEWVIADAFPTVREWLGPRNAQSLQAYSIAIKNRDWEMTIKERRSTIEDAKSSIGGVIGMQIDGSIQRFNSMPDKLVQELLAANGTAFDGTAFFATGRPALKGATAIDNLKTGSGITAAQIKADFSTAKTALLGYRDRNDEPFNDVLDLVVYVPSHLFDLFETLRTSYDLAVTGGGNETNIYRNTFRIIVNYKQSVSDNDWYMINAANPFPPFIFQWREKPVWNVKDDREDLFVKFLADCRCGAGYGNPTAIVKVNN